MTDELKLITAEKLTAIVGKDRVLTDEPMSEHTTFKIGGNAKILVQISSEDEIVEIIRLLRDNNVDYYIIGNGSNLLVSDNGYDGVIIELLDGYSDIELLDADELETKCSDKDEYVYVKALAGTRMLKIGKFMAEKSLEGFECLGGIPGTVGGAVVMNAGAYGGNISDVLLYARVITKEGNILRLNAEELELGYRTSNIEKNGYIISSVVLKMKKGNSEEIKERISDYTQRRTGKQPLEYPSAGSTFKRPEGHFAGQLIDEAGLRGYKSGGAQISVKHAGFVINTGDATAEDVINVITHAQEEVFKRNNIRLETEVKRLGF
ncbi:UDP-N-acetylmuramate dehydrogenase [Howardella ureilytica]|nr:UDP-N-acetylmuramate dehydrogenase [Lachnospiraceae bacterium]MDY2956846.1 UDP-N-acetylmuramate dehydrogenase [Lachnospiraceae bacterium]